MLTSRSTQISKSEAGFVVAVEVPEGSAADAKQLRPICSTTFRGTEVIPHSLSVDDGYSSGKNRQWLKEQGVLVA